MTLQLHTLDATARNHRNALDEPLIVVDMTCEDGKGRPVSLGIIVIGDDEEGVVLSELSGFDGVLQMLIEGCDTNEENVQDALTGCVYDAIDSVS